MALGSRRVFISYLNDDNQTISGYFDLLEENASFVKFKSGSNVLTIPFHRILKVKEGC